jgi:acetyl-CoA carboxylase biotin carboxylase subunit
VELRGHAIECRLNAEDITRDFQPSPGQVTKAWFPSLTGLRVDTHIQPGAVISPYYDSMIAKLITWAATRDEAIDVMETALRVCLVDGVDTNVELHRAVMADPAFRKGGVDTAYLAGLLPGLSRPKETV